MKRWLCIILVALLLCAPAMAEEDAEAIPAGIPQDAVIPQDEVVELDVDGDGAMDSVSWTMEEDWEWYTFKLHLLVTLADGTSYRFDPEESLYIKGVYAADLDGDGAVELLASGDEASDDYTTYCLRLVKGQLVSSLFEDSGRGAYNGGYYRCCYGYVYAIDGNKLTMCGSQDMLGTWFAKRVYTLTGEGVFELADEGKWVRDMDQVDDDTWEHMSMTNKKPLPYTTPEGEAAELPVGTKLITVATDKEKTADFITQDGLEGTLSVELDEESWGWLIDGKSEEYYFDFVPYAD